MNRFTYPITFLENLAAHEIEDDQWKNIAYSYADVVPICEASAKEITGLGFGHVLTEEYYLFRVRFHPAINKKQRISFDGEFYEIKRIVKMRNNQRASNIVAFKIGEQL